MQQSEDTVPMNLQISIMSPDKTVYLGQAEAVTCKNEKGEFEKLELIGKHIMRVEKKGFSPNIKDIDLTKYSGCYEVVLKRHELSFFKKGEDIRRNQKIFIDEARGYYISKIIKTRHKSFSL